MCQFDFLYTSGCKFFLIKQKCKATCDPVNMDPRLVVGFHRLCGQEVAVLFLESTRFSASEPAVRKLTVIWRQVFDGVCFSMAVGRFQNALKFLNHWKQCFFERC